MRKRRREHRRSLFRQGYRVTATAMVNSGENSDNDGDVAVAFLVVGRVVTSSFLFRLGRVWHVG